MKNIFLLPTDKPSCKLQKTKYDNFFLSREIKSYSDCTNQNIYITYDEEPKKNELCIDGLVIGYFDKDEDDCPIIKSSKSDSIYSFTLSPHCKKIILTTDKDLIKDGVQAIDDEFLQWFVKNPNCERIEVEKEGYKKNGMIDESTSYRYKIITPKEETKRHLIDIMRGDEELGLYEEAKKETLEEAMNSNGYHYPKSDGLWREGVKFGVKWQEERMYSESDKIMKFLNTEKELKLSDAKTIERIKWYFETYFEQFKKK